jgi:two-component system cell cycle response regulator CpdR
MIRILLAHGDSTLRHYLDGVLAAAGHEVVSVGGGTRALPLLAEYHFDVLVTDVAMSGMDGIELAQHCSDLSPVTRIVFLNGFAAVAVDQSGSPGELPGWGNAFHLRRLVAEIERMSFFSLAAVP